MRAPPPAWWVSFRRSAAGLTLSLAAIAGTAGAQGAYELKAVRFSVHGDVRRVVIDVDGRVGYSLGSLPSPQRVYVDLAATRPGPALSGGTIAVGDELVRRIRVGRPQAGVTRVVLDLSAPAEPNVYWTDAPPRLVIDLRKPATGPAAETGALPEPPAPSPSPAEAAAEPEAPAPSPVPAPEEPNRTLHIPRVAEPPKLSDFVEGRVRQADARVVDFFQRTPGDGVPVSRPTTAYLSYDDDNLYAVFVCGDHPEQVRAHVARREAIGGDDRVSLFLDTFQDHRRAYVFSANALGIQQDSIVTEGQPEDFRFDTVWHTQGRKTSHGYVVWMAIPFKSLRFSDQAVQTWGIALGRTIPARSEAAYWPHISRRVQSFTAQMGTVMGIERVSPTRNVQLIPYAAFTRARLLGSSASYATTDDTQGGLDAKWTPNADTALDATINPDFSQIESDVAQIGANERFALFFPEKRPFFLESVDLYATPLQAVYTRAIADPKWGGRGTGRFGNTQYTALVTEDQGGGSVIIPGPDNSSLALLEQGSTDGILRVRHDVGKSFVSLLATARELKGTGYNRVLGPDFQWSVGGHKLTGQYLYSASETPNDPVAAEEWDGRRLSGHAGDVWYTYNTEHYDAYVEYKDIADEFRADLGFLPQVGIREGFTETGWTFRPTGFFSRIRPFVVADRTEDRDGGLVFRMASPGVGTDFQWNGFARVRWSWDRIRAQDGQDHPRRQLVFSSNISPSLVVSRIQLDGQVGEEIDFATGRTGHGLRANLFASFRPGNHVELQTVLNRQYLDVPRTPDAAESRLFTATVARLRATYTFNRRSFLRLILQDVDNEHVEQGNTHVLQGSALFSYKLNWQSVLFVGYGDDRVEDTLENLQPARRSVFIKLSYAFQG